MSIVYDEDHYMAVYRDSYLTVCEGTGNAVTLFEGSVDEGTLTIEGTLTCIEVDFETTVSMEITETTYGLQANAFAGGNLFAVFRFFPVSCH